MQSTLKHHVCQTNLDEQTQNLLNTRTPKKLPLYRVISKGRNGSSSSVDALLKKDVMPKTCENPLPTEPIFNRELPRTRSPDVSANPKIQQPTRIRPASAFKTGDPNEVARVWNASCLPGRVTYR